MTTATHTLATTITATHRVATAKADAADARHKLNRLADNAAAPIDKIMLMLAATFCHTAARQLAEAYTILSNYQTETLHHIEKGDRP
jgi:hypothetical protein